MFSLVKKVLIISCIFKIQSLLASPIIFDLHYSPFSSSNTLIATQNQLLDWQNHYKGTSYNDLEVQSFSDLWFPKLGYRQFFLEESFGKTIFKSSLRAGELATIWYPINLMVSVLQHEVFGHGYRMRSMGHNLGSVSKYKMQYKIDKRGFNICEAYTQFDFNRNPSFSEKIALSIAGLEANSIFANNLLLSWLEKGAIDGRQASLWRHNQFATHRYIQTLKGFDGWETCWLSHNSGHDIAIYFAGLHSCYFNIKGYDDHLNDLRFKARLGYFLNPFTYLSYLSELAYIVFNTPMPLLGTPETKCLVLPAYKVGLTPFGLEEICEVYIWGKSFAPILIYAKAGKFASHHFSGFGVESRSLLHTKYGSLGFKLDCWTQPPLIFDSVGYEDYEFENAMRRLTQSMYEDFGGALSLIYQKSTLNNLDLWAQIGGKTQGFLPGESLKAAPIIKLGLLFRF